MPERPAQRLQLTAGPRSPARRSRARSACCRTSRSSPCWSTGSTCKHSRSRSPTTSSSRRSGATGRPSAPTTSSSRSSRSAIRATDTLTLRLRTHRRAVKRRCEDREVPLQPAVPGLEVALPATCCRSTCSRGHDLDQVWRDEIADPVTHAPIGSGRSSSRRGREGQSLTASRNPRWRGRTARSSTRSSSGSLPSSNDQFHGNQGRLARPDLPAGPVRASPTSTGSTGSRSSSRRATAMEHLDFNVESATRCRSCARDGSDKPIAYSVDRACGRRSDVRHPWSESPSAPQPQLLERAARVRAGLRPLRLRPPGRGRR